MLVTDGILRARYHRSFEKESFLEPGQVYELNVDLWSTSLVFNKGHRIRVAVSSSNSPRFEANPNTGKPFRADKETRIAKNTVHLSLKYPSRIVLPVHEAASSDGPAGKLRSLLDKARAQHDVPALSAGIIDGSQPKQVAVVGMRKRGADDLATEDDQWHLGSNTKPITALLIALLIELGLLDWDTPLEDIFPQHADKWSADLKSITPAHLLTHTSGLPANALYALLLAGNQESEVRQREIVLKSLAATKLAAEPGAKYQYSNLGYIVLGAIIDARGKASWEEQLEKKVLQPLGIMNWGLGPAGEKQPWPHQTRGKPVSPDGSRDNPPILNSAGRVRMSVGDYQRFLAETLKLSRGEQGLLKSATAKKLYTNPYPVSPHSLSGWISFRKPQDLKDLVFGHDGSNTFNYCTALVIPDRQLAFCVMTNQGGPGGPGASACHQVQKELRTSSAKPASP
jgi:CubicO group peptidase (beta-lactamase class C family)